MRPAGSPRFAAFLALVVLACGGKPEPSPTPTPAAPATPVQRTEAPLPAPGQGGVFAHHGGLVQEAGPDLNVELVVAGGKATIYLYDASGSEITASGATGTLAIDGNPPAPIKPTADGGALEVAGQFPESFEARISIDRGGKTDTATLRYASGGQPK